jgi:DTW domain-containing protein YfiP
MLLEDKHIEYPDRCKRCFMRETHCICAHIPKIKNQVPMTIVMHARETYKTTNTGRIAHLALKNSRVLIRGERGRPLKSEDYFPQGPSYILLTLSDDAPVLSRDFINTLPSPAHLVVADGNWRQASRMRHREKALKNMPWVKLPPTTPSEYKLRREHHIEGLATIEAIARAYGIIENKNIQVQLEEIFKIMVTKTLSTRAPINT